MFTLSEYIFFISSYFIFVELFRLKQIQEGLIEKKNTPHNVLEFLHNSLYSI